MPSVQGPFACEIHSIGGCNAPLFPKLQPECVYIVLDPLYRKTFHCQQEFVKPLSGGSAQPIGTSPFHEKKARVPLHRQKSPVIMIIVW